MGRFKGNKKQIILGHLVAVLILMSYILPDVLMVAKNVTTIKAADMKKSMVPYNLITYFQNYDFSIQRGKEESKEITGFYNLYTDISNMKKRRFRLESTNNNVVGIGSKGFSLNEDTSFTVDLVLKKEGNARINIKTVREIFRPFFIVIRSELTLS